MAELAQAHGATPTSEQEAARTGPLRFLSSPYLTLISRLVLGVIFFLAGLTKLGMADSFATSINAYKMPLPDIMVWAMANFLPPLEVALGICLLIGAFTRVAGLISAGLMAIFLIALIQGWIRNLDIVCGCFAAGPGANPLGSAIISAMGPVGDILTNEKAGPVTVIRDIVLLLMGVHLFLVPTVFGVDNWR